MRAVLCGLVVVPVILLHVSRAIYGAKKKKPSAMRPIQCKLAILATHQSLRLGRPRIDDGTGFKQYLDDIGIVGALLSDPAHKAGRQVSACQADMSLDTDREAVQGTGGLSMFGKVFIELLGSGKGAFGEEFIDTVCLGRKGFG